MKNLEKKIKEKQSASTWIDVMDTIQLNGEEVNMNSIECINDLELPDEILNQFRISGLFETRGVKVRSLLYARRLALSTKKEVMGRIKYDKENGQQEASRRISDFKKLVVDITNSPEFQGCVNKDGSISKKIGYDNAFSLSVQIASQLISLARSREYMLVSGWTIVSGLLNDLFKDDEFNKSLSLVFDLLIEIFKRMTITDGAFVNTLKIITLLLSPNHLSTGLLVNSRMSRSEGYVNKMVRHDETLDIISHHIDKWMSVLPLIPAESEFRKQIGGMVGMMTRGSNLVILPNLLRYQSYEFSSIGRFISYRKNKDLTEPNMTIFDEWKAFRLRQGFKQREALKHIDFFRRKTTLTEPDEEDRAERIDSHITSLNVDASSRYNPIPGGQEEILRDNDVRQKMMAHIDVSVTRNNCSILWLRKEPGQDFDPNTFTTLLKEIVRFSGIFYGFRLIDGFNVDSDQAVEMKVGDAVHEMHLAGRSEYPDVKLTTLSGVLNTGILIIVVSHKTPSILHYSNIQSVNSISIPQYDVADIENGDLSARATNYTLLTENW